MDIITPSIKTNPNKRLLTITSFPKILLKNYSPYSCKNLNRREVSFSDYIQKFDVKQTKWTNLVKKY